MKMYQKLVLLAVSAPLVASVVGCNGADNPKIATAPPPPAVSPAEAKANMPKNKYMENSRYKEGMEKMQNAASGK